MIAPTLTGNAGNGQNTIDWNSVPKAVKYRLRRATGNGAFVVIDTVTNTHYTDDNVTNGVQYKYMVRGIDSRGDSGPDSNIVSLTPTSGMIGLPTLVGHGAGVTGGGDATPSMIETAAQFLEAIQDSGKRVLVGNRQWLFGNGQFVRPGSGDLTLIDLSWGKMAVKFDGDNDNIRIHNCRGLPNSGAPVDSDGLTLNGQSSEGPISGVGISNSWFCGGPDIGGMAILGEVFDLTIQHTVIGPGLVMSQGSDSRDHNRVFNFTTFGDHADGPFGRRMTAFENLVWGGEERNPDIKYVESVDFIRNLIYNFRESPNGNPRGLNYMYNRVRSGPQTNLSKAKTWEGQAKPGEVPFQQSVYSLGNVADGFDPKETFLQGTQRNSPFGTPSVAAVSAPTVDQILELVGPTSGFNSQEQRLLDHVRNRTSDGYYTGAGFGTPNLTWPTNP